MTAGNEVGRFWNGGRLTDLASWGSGDWNGDGDFTSDDIVTALADGGYEQGPRAAVAAVPEPNSLVPLMLGLMQLTRCAVRQKQIAQP